VFVTVSDISLELALIGAGTLFGAGLIKGLMGVGMPLFAVPVLVTFMDLPTAVVTMMVPVFVTNFQQALQARQPAAIVRRFAGLLVPMIGCAIFSALYLITIDLTTGSLVLGIVVIVFALFQMSRLRWTIAPRLETWLNPPIGALAGILGGASNLFGPPLIMYLVALKLDKDEFVGAIAVFFLIGSVALYVTLFANGVLTTAGVLLSAAAAVPAVIATYAGNYLRRFIDQRQFERALLVVLILIGANLMRRVF